MNYFFSALLALVAFGISVPTTYAAVETGLVRTQDASTVYFATGDGRRLTFSNERIYRSWYPDFSNVQVISSNDLAGMRLTGAVLYRPGQLIKITTDPKVYLVTEYGLLRWIPTEALALAIAGPAWAQHVDDLSDAFFSSYVIGAPVTEQESAPVARLRSNPTSITINNRLLPEITPIPTPSPAPSPTSTTPAPLINDLLLRVSDALGVRPGESVFASLYAIGTMPERLDLFVNDAPRASCMRTSPCTYELAHPLHSGASSYTLRAIATLSGGITIEKTLVVPVQDAQAGGLRLLLTQNETRNNTNVDMRAEWRNTTISIRRLTILVDGIEQKSCFSGTICTLNYGISGTIGTTFAIQAVVEDTSGARWTTPTSTLTIVTNDRPILTIGTNTNTLFIGEQINLNAQASDGEGIGSIEIWRNGTSVARCERPFCSYTTEPLTTTDAQTFRVVATDLLGASREQTLADIVVLARPR